MSTAKIICWTERIIQLLKLNKQSTCTFNALINKMQPKHKSIIFYCVFAQCGAQSILATCPSVKSADALRSISCSLCYRPEEENVSQTGSGTDNQWVLLLPTAICTAQSEALGTRITLFFSKLIAVKPPHKSQPLSYLWLYPAWAWNLCMTAGWGKGPTPLSPWEMKSRDKYLQSAPSIYQLQINSRSGSDSSYF